MKFKIVVLFLSVFIFVGTQSNLSAQCAACVQDTTNCSGPTGAVCPDVLPDADNGFAYDQDITFNMVAALEIPGVGIGLEITQVVPSIEGLPSGLSATFSASQYNPDESDPASQYGCLKICGVPCAGNGTYTIQVVLGYTASAVGFPISLDVPYELELQVNAPYEPLEILSTSNYLCSGGNVDLEANDNHASYLWTGGNTSNAITVTTAGVYGLEVRDTINGNECVLNDTIEILDFAPDAGSDFTICKGEIRQLFATGADEFSWSPGAGLSDSTVSNPVILDLDSTTTFTLTGFNDSCTSTAQVTVTVDQNCPRDCPECVVDMNCTGQGGFGVCPDVLPVGTASEPYQTTFSFNFPYEFDIASQFPIPIPLPGLDDITVEYVRIEGVNNLPAGLTWESDQKAAGNMYYPGLVDDVTGRGCITICGDIDCVPAGIYDLELEASLGVNGIPASLQGLLNFLPQFNNGEFVAPIPITMEVIYTNPLTITPSGTVNLDFGDSITLVASDNGLTGHEWSTGETGTEITVDESGFYTVTAFDGTCDQTTGVQVQVAPAVGIDELNISQFEIYPNPAQSEVIVSWSSQERIEAIRVYDLQGKLLYTTSVEANISQKNISVDQFSSGLYFVELNTASSSVQKKLIKQ